MKEAIFINRYKEKWKDLENYLSRGGSGDPDYLSSLYVQLTDDLSYAKTHYPDSKVTIYLNQLSSKLHAEIYKNKKESSRRFITFWTEEVPLVIYKRRAAVFVSLIGFIIAFMIGWVSGANDDGFVRLVLGDTYVDMTKKYIDEGNPMGVYGDDNATNMFLYITFNNIFVCIRFCLWGIFFGIGALYWVFRTGIMLGAFLYMFYEADLTAEALMAVWMHGVIEITVCIFSGAAGMILGTSWMFPGTYPRGVALLRGAKDAIKILFGLIPFLVICGFIEGFVTRHSTNVLLSGSTILLSLGFVISYLVVYPYVVSRKAKKIRLQGFQYGYQYPEFRIKLVVGAMWLVGGILATAVTLGASGGVGILFTGAIATGIVKIIQGLGEWSKYKSTAKTGLIPSHQENQQTSFNSSMIKKKKPNKKIALYLGFVSIGIGLIFMVFALTKGFFFIPISSILLGLAFILRYYWDQAKQESQNT